MASKHPLHPLDDLWPVIDPPPGFGQRVLAALENPGAIPGDRPAAAEAPAPDGPPPAVPSRPVRGARTLGLIACGLGGAVAAAALLVTFSPEVERKPDGGARSGHLVADVRQTLAIGERGLAVAERGAELAWFVVAGHPRVDQPRGSVFYRVDRGGPFTVTTPVGDVRVTGTCFRIVVAPAAGADGPTVALVEVLEGSVLLSGGRGELALTAGEKGRMSLHAAPRRLEPESDTSAKIPDRRPELEARVRRLEQSLVEARRGAPGARPLRDKYFDLTADDRRALARRCELRYYLPRHLTAIDAPSLDESISLGLDGAQREGLLQLMQEQRADYVETLQSLYAEVTGERAIALRLAPKSLQEELFAKLDPEDLKDARRRILDEWEKGSSVPHRGPRPPAERFMRLVAGGGDGFFRKLVDLVGPEQARQIRERTTSDTLAFSPAFDCKPQQP
jgi:hypothetical protein